MSDAYFAAVYHYVKICNLQILPTWLDGSKATSRKWEPFRQKTDDEKLAYFLQFPSGIAIRTGKINQNLEVIDFDDYPLYSAWLETLPADCQDIVSTLPLVQTPRPAFHLYYRCAAVQGNQKLAERPDEVALIETRGSGGYTIAPGSPLTVHKNGTPYLLLQGNFKHIPFITPEQRQLFFIHAKKFNLNPKMKTKEPFSAKKRFHQRRQLRVNLPPTAADDFCAKTSWEDILETFGWTIDHSLGGITYWRRPQKTFGHSATTNCDGSDRLYVFSSSTNLPSLKFLTKFAAYAHFQWNGHYAYAAFHLAKIGFGMTPTLPDDITI